MSSNACGGHVSRANNSKKGISSKQDDKKSGDEAKNETAAIRCRFLELPAEIRNRIYHYAEEELHDDYDNYVDFAPPLLVRNTKAAADSTTVPHVSSTLRYRALTQVCKQIRTEYRPMWLRQSCFRMELPTVAQFINAYFPKVTDHQIGPKLLLISWDHGPIGNESDEDDDDDEEYMDGVLTNINLLIRLRARYRNLTIQFISRRVLEDDVSNMACIECGHSIHCGCDNGCDHEDTWDEALWEVRWSYHYLTALNHFLANTNENWLKTVCDTTILQPRVDFTFDIGTQSLTIYIRFSKGQAPSGFKLKSMYNPALDFLDRSGMIDLEASESIDYVIGEATSKYTRHALGCSNYIVTYNQIHLDDATIAAWKKKKEAKASAS